MRDRADLLEDAAELESEDDNGVGSDSSIVRADIAEMRALRDAADFLDDADIEEYGETVGNIHYWFTSED